MKKLLYLICVSSMFGTNLFGQDLKMEHLWLPNTNTALGSTIYPSALVSNLGAILSNPSNIGFYLSKNPKLKVTDTFLGSSYLNSIYPNSSDSSVASITIPSDIKEGTYYLFAFADYQGVVFETNEKNNSSYIKITVSSPTVDLSISSIYPNSLNYSAGQNFSATVVESNTGNTFAKDHYIGYYFSNDASLDSSDLLLTYNYNYGVKSGSVTYDYPNFYLPSNISSGDYYIIASADYGNNLPETDETNNNNSVKISIIEPISDLSVPSFYSYNSSVAAGTYMSANTTLSNSGNTFLSNVTIGYYLSADSVFGIGDTYLTSNYVGYLYAGNTFSDYPSFLISSDVPAGNYFVLAVADYNNLIEESNEENNVNILPITVVAPAIDLSLYSLSTFPSDVAAGSSLNASVYEFNYGDSYAPSHSIQYFLSADSTYDSSDVYLNSDYVYGTYSGSYNYLNPSLYIPAGISSGNYFILAISDFNAEIEESNENNNMLFSPITISAPFIDLTISPLAYETLKVTPGSYAYPQMTEYNSGNDFASTHYTGYFLSADSTYDIGDTYLGSDYVSGIYGNNGYGLNPSLFISSDVPKGSYYILAVADYVNYITETNEDNNVATFKMDVVDSEVDFSTSFLYTDSTYVTSGSYLYPTVLEYNNGTTYSPGNYVGYYLSNDLTLDTTDTFITSDYVYGISAGSYAYLTPYIPISSTQAPGTYYLLASADYPNQVSETDEANNISALKIIIKPSQVDLSISDFVADSMITAGNYVYTNLIAHNNGSDYIYSNNIGYYLSNDAVLDAYDMNVGNATMYNLYPGGSYFTNYIYIPYYTQKGNYYLIAVADNGNSIIEFDETNNYQAIPVRIGINGVDLTIPSISATNTNPSAGSFIFVTNTESNEGNLEAGAHHLGYFLSKDSTYDVSDKYLASNYFASLAGGSSAEFNPALFIPTTTPDGVYYIVAVADYGNTNIEIDEYNNTKALRIVIGNIPMDDVELSLNALSVYSFDSTNGGGQTKNYFYAYFTELNNGSSYATGHNVGFYLSTDTAFSYDDMYLNSSYVYGVNAYSATNQSTELYIPYYVPAGQYFIVAKSDDGNYLAESNEYNNERATPITVEEVKVDGLSSADMNKSTIQLYPNPSNGIVNFNSLENMDEVEVLDINNHVVASQTIAAMSGNSLDLSSVSAGVYFVKTKKQGVTTSTNKLVINK